MLPNTKTNHFILSSSPHTHAKCSVSSLMLDVIIALLPALVCSVYFFGVRALLVTATCISTCLLTELVCRLAMKRENTIGDLSAVLTGLLLAFNLPPAIPLWMAVCGSVFAIAVAKQVFGGLGYNPFNPALAARAFMLISFTGAMTTWTQSEWGGKLAEAATSATPVAAVTTATPLGMIKGGLGRDTLASMNWEQMALFKDLFFGNVNGCIGEVSAFALLIGVVYLLWRRVITWHIPAAFIGSVFLFALFLRGAQYYPAFLSSMIPEGANAIPPFVHVLSGGVILGACFMATDYVTSPITAKGKIIFGIGCGVLTMLIRTAPTGSYPEGVSFAILIMNAFTPIINRYTQPKVFGAKKA